MITLKEYQNRVLDSLRTFLRRCSQTGNAETAFREVTMDEDGVAGVPYAPVNVAGLSRLPYVCLRLPPGQLRAIGGQVWSIGRFLTAMNT